MRDIKVLGLVIVLLSINAVAALKQKSNTRVDFCTAGVQGTPIEINLPNIVHIRSLGLTQAFNIDMDFTNNNGTRLRKIDNNHILYMGDFGSIGYLNAKHTIERVDVFAPSLHMAFGVTYPMEV